jgi:DNA-binding HxlR family transcriptional regulator
MNKRLTLTSTQPKPNPGSKRKPEAVTPEHANLGHGERIQLQPECTVERTLEVIGGKWTTLILRDLLSGTKRFGELRASLGNIPPKTLTERLRNLEEQGALERVQFPEIPPRVEYTLTEKGRALGAIIDAMAHWGSSWT